MYKVNIFDSRQSYIVTVITVSLFYLKKVNKLNKYTDAMRGIIKSYTLRTVISFIVFFVSIYYCS